jgi:hypothetical protein
MVQQPIWAFTKSGSISPCLRKLIEGVYMYTSNTRQFNHFYSKFVLIPMLIATKI